MKSPSQDPFQKARDLALSLLARRRHSREELRRKLSARGFGPEIAGQVIIDCQRLGYIDDETTADLYAAELARKRFGVMRIRDAMKIRGFDESLIARAIEAHELEAREPELAAMAIEKKRMALERETDERKKREKVIRFLQSRGFRTATIYTVLDEMTSDDT